MQMENGGQKRTAFSTYAKPPNIRKAFSQHSKIENSHRTQTNVQQPFSNVACRCELAVQQPFFRKFAVLRQHKGNPFAPIQILTGDTREGCNSRHSRLHDERRSFQRKSRIERRFESSPESRGSQTSGVLPVLFVQAKRIKPFPFGKFEVSQTSNQHTQTTTTH